jgi:hypothetical protein
MRLQNITVILPGLSLTRAIENATVNSLVNEEKRNAVIYL